MLRGILRCRGWRGYHSNAGVYGHRPRPQEPFNVSQEALESRQKQSNFYRLVTAFREVGHKTAHINPVELRGEERNLEELNPARYGLSLADRVDFKGILNVPAESGTLSEAISFLQNLYCEHIASEFSYLETEEEREWFAWNTEAVAAETLSATQKKQFAGELLRSQTWDVFLATKFPAIKRYGGEGAESMTAFFIELFGLMGKEEVEKLIIGMSHRGKLNILTGMFGCPPSKIFMKYRGRPEFPNVPGVMCDIPNHFSVSHEVKVEGKSFQLSMVNNPSHLEIVNPVSMGKARSKQQDYKEGDYSINGESRQGEKIINLQIHGDAAFAGQGVNQECLMLAQTPNFDVGGSIHLIINNQVGFTTPGERGRSSRYCSDLAKSINSPVIHVNGDHPELVVKATKIAFEYQRKFRKDVFIDFNCFRRWGHNEMDDPTFTNPIMYQKIHNRKSVPDLYAEKLVSEGVMTQEDVDSIVSDYTKTLNEELKLLDTYQPEQEYFQDQWAGMTQAPAAIETWETGLPRELLNKLGTVSVQYPSDFNIHPHLLKTHVKNRLSKLADGSILDWATAEALAVGSLLVTGHNVRFSGEDVGRGTFSQRHAMLVDQQTGGIMIPLNSIEPEQKGKLEVANSILSEEAVLGFEYGMAMDQPNNLVVWEAQFGDFFNGAQIVFDTYIASGETKWMKSNGLVVLLPHGYDGAGPEHSSCRLERFLQLTDSHEDRPDGDDINLQVVIPTTPAQYFHLLRRQIVRNYRKPIIIVAPKTLLRLSDATSSFSDMGTGTHFLPVIGDDSVDPLKVKRVIFVSGKHFYTLDSARKEKKIKDVAILRLESLCPFPLVCVQKELEKYKNAKTFIWSQEEPRNQGAWTFVKPRFENLAAKKMKYCGRDTAACPAVGVSTWHRAEAEALIESTFS